jgi:hypothetical protein
MTLRVSCVLTAWNAAWCIERAIASALSQEPAPLEVIVCDDGSTDDTVALIERRFGAAVDVLRLPHRNASAARRVGLARARGDWLAFLDADDVWHADKLARQARFLERHPGVRWITADGRLVDTDGVLRDSWLADYFDPVRETAGDLFPALLQRCFPLVSATMVERSAYEAVGGLDPEIVYSHDYDLWLRLAARYPGGIQAEPLVDYLSSPSSLSRRFDGRHRDDLRLMRRVEAGTLGHGPGVRRAAAERAAALEFELARVDLRAGDARGARARLWRSLRAGPWRRRALALGGALAPPAVLGPLLRSAEVRRVVESVRHVPGTVPLPGEEDA